LEVQGHRLDPHQTPQTPQSHHLHDPLVD
jgi:hypothetical protein